MLNSGLLILFTKIIKIDYIVSLLRI